VLLVVKLAALLLKMEKWNAVIGIGILFRDVREHFQLEFLRVFLACEGLFLEKRDVEFVFLKLVPERQPLKERCGGEHPQESLLVGISVLIFVSLEEVLVLIVLVVVVGVNQQCGPKRLAVLVLQAVFWRFLLQLVVVTEQRREKPEECFPDFIDIGFFKYKLLIIGFFKLFLSLLLRLEPKNLDAFLQILVQLDWQVRQVFVDFLLSRSRSVDYRRGMRALENLVVIELDDVSPVLDAVLDVLVQVMIDA